jgi:hypothetical protein
MGRFRNIGCVFVVRVGLDYVMVLMRGRVKLRIAILLLKMIRFMCAAVGNLLRVLFVTGRIKPFRFILGIPEQEKQEV